HGVRDARADHAAVLAVLHRVGCARPVPVQHAAGRGWSHRHRQERGADRRHHLVLSEDETMKTQTKLVVGTLSVGLLALNGCIAPPPGGAGAPPGSAGAM